MAKLRSPAGFFFFVFLSGLLMVGNHSFAFAQSANEKGKCVLKIKLSEEEREGTKFQHLMNIFAYKMEEEKPTFTYQSGRHAYGEFELKKNCEEALRVLIKNL